MSKKYSTQKELLLNTLLRYYNKGDNLEKILLLLMENQPYLYAL